MGLLHRTIMKIEKKPDALVHLRVPAEMKGRWVKESRLEGMKLTDWITSRVEAKALSIADVLEEAATLAKSLEDSPIFYRNKLCADGIVTIQQQAARFSAATDDATRLDAALWAREGYQLLSSGLPDSYSGVTPNEGRTGWVTASQLARLFGGEVLWIERCQREFGGEGHEGGR